jgi:hypothetical protein
LTVASREEARAGMLAFMPEPVVDGTLDIQGSPAADEQRISPDVARVLKRRAGSFGDWIKRTVDAFR